MGMLTPHLGEGLFELLVGYVAAIDADGKEGRFGVVFEFPVNLFNRAQGHRGRAGWKPTRTR